MDIARALGALSDQRVIRQGGIAAVAAVLTAMLLAGCGSGGAATDTAPSGGAAGEGPLATEASGAGTDDELAAGSRPGQSATPGTPATATAADTADTTSGAGTPEDRAMAGAAGEGPSDREAASDLGVTDPASAVSAQAGAGDAAPTDAGDAALVEHSGVDSAVADPADGSWSETSGHPPVDTSEDTAGDGATTTATDSGSPDRPAPGDDVIAVEDFVASDDVPDLAMVDLSTGSMVSLRSVVSGATPLLFWFWSPL